MNNRKQSIDGFVPRRGGSELGERHDPRMFNGAPERREIHSSSDLQKAQLGQARQGKTLGRSSQQHAASRSIGRSDIDDSLRELDDEPPRKKLSRKERKRQKKANRTPAQRRRRLIIKIIIFAIIAALLIGGGILVFKLFRASDGVLNGSIFDLVQNQPLKEDINGRSNFLILGTSEDDPGHQGGNLTDSMLVLSVDQKNKNAYMFSIPRDLYVSYGMACTAGYKGKINSYFSCVNNGTDDAAEQDRLTKTQQFVGTIVGMDIQYGVHVNYTVMRDVVNAIGGSIQVDIEGNDGTGPSHKIGIMDSNFDWKCGDTRAKKLKNCPPNGHFIDYEPGVQTLDAEHTLYLAQARGDAAPTYGLAQSNFDRERNQQKIMVAIRDKALSAGTLTNIGAVTGLIDALGNNLRTNIATKEVRTLMDVAQHIPSTAITSIDFYAPGQAIFTTGSVGSAGSSVYPKAGIEDYSELQAFVKKQLSSNPIEREGAVLMVLNGSGVAGAAQTVADSLESKGMTIGKISNAPAAAAGTYSGMEIYQVNEKMTATAAKLQELYGVTVKTTKPPVSVTGNTDFVVIVGEGAATTKSSSSSSN